MASITSADKAQAAPRARRVMHLGSLGMLLGGVMLIIGAVTPWVSTPFLTFNATQGPGLWILCAGTIAVAGALIPHRIVAIAQAALPGVVTAALVAWQLGLLIYVSATTDAWGQLLPGIGMVLTAGGAVVLLRAAWRMYRAE
jgi:hypothetical protein